MFKFRLKHLPTLVFVFVIINSIEARQRKSTNANPDIDNGKWRLSWKLTRKLTLFPRPKTKVAVWSIWCSCSDWRGSSLHSVSHVSLILLVGLNTKRECRNVFSLFPSIDNHRKQRWMFHSSVKQKVAAHLMAILNRWRWPRTTIRSLLITHLCYLDTM